MSYRRLISRSNLMLPFLLRPSSRTLIHTSLQRGDPAANETPSRFNGLPRKPLKRFQVCERFGTTWLKLGVTENGPFETTLERIPVAHRLTNAPPPLASRDRRRLLVASVRVTVRASQRRGLKSGRNVHRCHPAFPLGPSKLSPS